MKRFVTAALALFAPFCSALAQNASAQDITVTRGNNPAQVIHHADWSAFRRIETMQKDRDGTGHVYSGVAVSDLLQKAGVPMGKALRGESMSQYLLVKAADGYRVLFALPELDSAFAEKTILLVDTVDGKPLPEAKGPFRIVVPGEKKPARWIYQVRTLAVRFAKDE